MKRNPLEFGTTRRRFNRWLASGAAGLALPRRLRARDAPRVVIIGGGAGGATAARTIAEFAEDRLAITLIDDADTYTSCFYSNLHLGGLREWDDITHDYATLVSDYGIDKITARAIGVDREARTVSLDDGSTRRYDRLIIAPGIDIVHDSVPGYSRADEAIAPHAWQGGSQTALLKAKLDRLGDGDGVVMIAPPNPYRCPPGPYERASMIAQLFRDRGFENSTVTILDSKASFSKQTLFSAGWERHFPGTIEWIPPDVHGGILAVDAASGTVETDLDVFEAALLNVIPAQVAGQIARAAGLTDDSGYCPIDANSMRSSRDPSTFVIGDASIAGDMPKSGFSANSQARIAAMHVLGDLLDAPVSPAAYANACWSLLATDDGVKVGASYAPIDGRITATSTFVSEPGESAERRKTTYEESVDWYASITRDMFG